MTELQCKAFAYRLQGLSAMVIKRRLMTEGASELDANRAILHLDSINKNALPIPQITCHYEKRDGMWIWWQNNWFGDQWDTLNDAELENRQRITIILGHKVVEGLPDDSSTI